MMPENAVQYMVRDPQGNLFGPADQTLLRQWVTEGRIVAGMSIAVRDSDQWVEASVHPAVADLLTVADAGSAGVAPYATSAAGAPSSSPVPLTPELSYAQPPKLHPLALASLITGGLGGGCCCFLSVLQVPLDLAAIITGVMALWQIQAQPTRYTGKPMAILGIILGGGALLVYVTFIVVAIVSNVMHR
jgi:hypothetical protein